MARNKTTVAEAAEQLGRSMGELKRAFGNVSATIGGQLLPSITEATKAITAFYEEEQRRRQWRDLKIAFAVCVVLHIVAAWYMWAA